MSDERVDSREMLTFALPVERVGTWARNRLHTVTGTSTGKRSHLPPSAAYRIQTITSPVNIDI